MITAIFGWLLKFVSGGIVEKALDAFTKSEDIRVRGKEIDAATVSEAMRQYVESQRIQNETQRAKFQFPWFWILASLFVLPLAMWYGAVLLDSTFNLPIQVANLPTQELRDWSGQIVTFLFYTGGTVAGIKTILGSR